LARPKPNGHKTTLGVAELEDRLPGLAILADREDAGDIDEAAEV
jgi:hypothetical protein